MSKFDETYKRIVKENIDSTGIGTEKDNYITDGFVDIEYLKPYEIEKLHNFTVKHGLVYNPETGRWDCDHDLEIYRDVKWEVCVQGGDKLGIKFGVVKGKFMIGTGWLRTLKGCPTRVEGDCIITETQIGSFRGGPEYVGGYFNADSCGVTSLDGLPKFIGGNLQISHCNYLNKCDLDPDMVIKGDIISFGGCSRAGHTREFYEELQQNLPKTFNGTIILPKEHERDAKSIRNGFFNDPSWC